MTPDVQAEYARLAALARVRLDELEQALDAHERNRVNWSKIEVLARVERMLAGLTAEVATS